MLTVWLTDKVGNGPIFSPYSDDNEKNTFNKGGNGLENVTLPLMFMSYIAYITEFQFSQG